MQRCEGSRLVVVADSYCSGAGSRLGVCVVVLCDCRCEIEEVCIERAQEPHGRLPANIDVSFLNLGDVGVVSACARCQLQLSDSGSLSQLAQRSAKSEWVCCCVRAVRSIGSHRYAATQQTLQIYKVTLWWAHHKIVRARCCSSRPRGSESSSLPARWPRYQPWGGASSQERISRRLRPRRNRR